MAITSEFIAKIEGHGSLKIDWEKEIVKLHIHEGERLFEGILVGRTAEEAHWITPRICGVCPIAHNLASLAAVEDAYDIEITETPRLLRDLMMRGQMIQSHILHLFFLALPDYLGIDRGTELAQKDPDSFAKALALKELGDEIAYTIAGRNVHPTRTTIGGFHKIPSKEELEKLLKKLEATRRTSQWVADFCSKLDYPELKVDFELVAQEGGEILSSKKEKVPIKEYKINIQEELRESSTAKFGKFRNKEMMVGSLARLALNGKREKYDIDFENPFHNNIAQAIEVEKFHKEAIGIIDKLLHMDMVLEPFVPTLRVGDSPTRRVGLGAIEAPRGGLYHEIHLDENSVITYANIITPTVQNLTSIEKSAQALIDQTKDKEQKERERLLNMLIRAYDPCITCSVH
ncbi:MAG: nickel-dependent hydrogenase large subunit [Patescibacteria group bacterium]